MAEKQEGLKQEIEREELMDYSIKGKVSPEELKKIPKEVSIVAYAVRDRRVLGSAPIEEDGRFEVNYNYKVFGKDRQAYGVDLIIGPELPGDQILKTDFERKFLSSKGFRRASPKWTYEIAETVGLSDKWYAEFYRIVPLRKCEFTYTGFVYTCSPLNIPPGGQAGCVSQEALSSVEAEAYVRLSRPSTSSIIAEDIEIDLTGRFEKTTTWYSLICLYVIAPVKVEVYQKTDAGDHILYTGDHYFTHNVAEDIFIDRDKVEIVSRPPNPTPGTGRYFGFERVGNIPVEAVYKAGEVTGEFGAGVPVPGEFVGYVNSQDKPGVVLGDADLKIKDYAFGGVLHLYANIGEDFGTPYSGGVDMSEVSIKYFRIKYSYENPETGETIADTYISAPFSNTRKTVGGTTTEFLGAFNNHPVTGVPLPHPTYVYPNPYETAVDKNWKFRGLILVLNTYILPRKYGKYRFTLEPLDLNMNPPVPAVANPDDCGLTLLIDNDHDALTGEIANIFRDSVGTTVCGLVDLTGTGSCIASNLRVKYAINDGHGNLRNFSLAARYGKDKSVTGFVYPGNTYYSRPGTNPYWYDVDEEATKSHAWQQCAYEFRIVAWRRVTNGFYTIPWKEFTYHVTIMSDTSYVTVC